MSERVVEPTDAEFSAMMDQVAPDRQQLADPDNATPAEPAAVASEPAAPAVEEELPEKYRGKTPAEIVQMHQAAEQRLGQQGAELGELRALREEFSQWRESQTPAEPAPWEAQTAGLDSFEERVLTDPKGTLDWVKANSPQLLERGIEVWAQLDPFAAGRYETQHQLAAIRAEHAQELAAVRAPVVQQQNDVMLQQAYTNVANTNPLLASVAEDIPALLEANPEFKVLLGNGDVPTRERALNNLVAIAAQGRAENTTPADTAASAAHQAKTLAAVVTSGSAAEHGGQSGSTAASRMLASEGTSVADELARNRAKFGR